ncbi:MAG: hypothetical protein K8S56_10475, partial [Candidatus Cloacimonetes bacterium]|nr:hypothetical protein [Candidatus Cloacimonadota bacterium]
QTCLPEEHKNLTLNIFKYAMNFLNPSRYTSSPPFSNPTTLNGIKTIGIGSNKNAVEAAISEAKAAGFTTKRLPTLTCDVSTGAKIIFDEIASYNNSVCLVGGGEMSLNVTGNGVGGRNQQLALEMFRLMQKHGKTFHFASLATDGNDGPTDAAGAFANPEILATAKAKEMDIDNYLTNNDSYTFFMQTNGLFQSGMTGTNVCDIYIVINNT